MKIKSYVIHLERAKERREAVDELVKKLPYSPVIFSAVDGRAFSESDRETYFSNCPLFKPTYPFEINNSEIACFLSHRRIWQKIVDEDLDAALICEDDLKLEEQFQKAAEFAEAHIKKYGYIQFQVRKLSGLKILESQLPQTIASRKVVPLRTSCQMVSREMALQLLDASNKVDRPVDAFVQLHWLFGFKPVLVDPPGVSDLTKALGRSLISSSNKQGIFQKVRREFKRLKYRLAIHLIS